jgi:transglutaminase/protease-like cytokinesis protein 3
LHESGNYIRAKLLSFAGINVPVTGVTLNPTSTSIAVNGTGQLTVTVLPNEATNKSVTWSTSNPAIATVSSSGLVTGISAGTATITVTTVDGNKTATCEVTVIYGINLLLNPGFETSSNWTIESPPFSRTVSTAHSGSYALKLKGSGSWKNTYQTVNVVPNTAYTFSVYIKGTANVYMAIYKSDWSAQIATRTVSPTSGWVLYTLTFNSGNNTQLLFDLQDASRGTSYIDDASLL